MTIHLIHGIHTEPTSPVKGLVPYLVAAGWKVRYPEYGYELALETKVINQMISGTIAAYVEPDDILVGHSNGCALAFAIMQTGIKVAGAVFINGALESDFVRPAGCPWIDVYFNQGDEITRAAQLGEELGIVTPIWGELGHTGYVGKDPMVSSIDCYRTPDMPVVDGHSDFFTPTPQLAFWAPYLDKRIRERLAH
jgi:pimeloyl-ACP methyl ester carboxylesterase